MNELDGESMWDGGSGQEESGRDGMEQRIWD